MSNPNGEPCYTEEELQQELNKQEQRTIKYEIDRWVMRAMDTMTPEEIRKEVEYAIGITLADNIDTKDPEELDRFNYPNGFISSKEQQINEPGYPHK